MEPSGFLVAPAPIFFICFYQSGRIFSHRISGLGFPVGRILVAGQKPDVKKAKNPYQNYDNEKMFEEKIHISELKSEPQKKSPDPQLCWLQDSLALHKEKLNT